MKLGGQEQALYLPIYNRQWRKEASSYLPVVRSEWAWVRKELMKSTYTVEGRHPIDDDTTIKRLDKTDVFLAT